MKNTSYVSAATQFLNTLLAKPEIKKQQAKLRKTWWDTDFIDPQEQKAYHAAQVKAEAYVYFSYPKQK